jgi:hypothetical protein
MGATQKWAQQLAQQLHHVERFMQWICITCQA